MDRDLTGRYLDDLRDLGPVIDTILDRYNIVVDTRWPLNFEDDLVDVDGSRIWAERLASAAGRSHRDDGRGGSWWGFAVVERPTGPGDGPEAA